MDFHGLCHLKTCKDTQNFAISANLLKSHNSLGVAADLQHVDAWSQINLDGNGIHARLKLHLFLPYAATQHIKNPQLHFLLFDRGKLDIKQVGERIWIAGETDWLIVGYT